MRSKVLFSSLTYSLIGVLLLLQVNAILAFASDLTDPITSAITGFIGSDPTPTPSPSATPTPTPEPTSTPVPTPTPIPTLSVTGKGSFDVTVGNYSLPIDGIIDIDQEHGQINLTCELGHTNCSFSATFRAKNRTTSNLYKPTVWADNPFGLTPKILEFAGFDGVYTEGPSYGTRTTQPGEEAINTAFRITSPTRAGIYYSYMYIDAQTCNLQTTPPDCIYYGGSGITVKVTVNPAPSATPVPSPTPDPITSPITNPSPTPSPIPSPDPITSPITDPTPSPTPSATPEPEPVTDPSPTPSATPAPEQHNDNNNSGRNDSPAQAPVCVDSKPESAPKLLSASANGKNQVTLTWSKAADPVTYYLVAYGTKSGKLEFGNPNVGGKNATSYTVKGLENGKTYFFKVRAGNHCMPGEFSNELSVKVTGEISAINLQAASKQEF